MSDVCLILEGTYPYVTGGVSACVYQLIKNTPQVTYDLIFIGATKNNNLGLKYPIPENVKYFREIYLYEYFIPEGPIDLNFEIDHTLIADFHQALTTHNMQKFEELFLKIFQNEHFPSPEDLLRSRQVWQYLEQAYRRLFPGQSGPSFIDYFYTWRFSHFPIFKLLTTEIPHARVYHSFCTGYAGLLASIAKIKTGRPYVLSEHGIYSNEREIEISLSEWIYRDQAVDIHPEVSQYFKTWWTRLFLFLGKLSYHHADVITTLFRGNQNRQVEHGASLDKIQIIPNGIELEKFSPGAPSTKTHSRPVIGMVGRIVSIKDVKTFIKCLLVVKQKIADFEAYLVGPYTEEPDYYEECKKLVTLLELDSHVIFTGKADVRDYYPKFDVLVLTSISEGQPLVLLEAMAMKIPLVATDVGACRELIVGRDFEDQMIGHAGITLPMGDAARTGEAVLKILSDKELARQYGENGRARVLKYYTEDQNIRSYMSLYNHYMAI
ncbi:MAG: hypothetical protein A2X86_00930 [Bdellovibrionales bacterium GWA2_49_15]|nr:MAG: hypothetical protein A2X86_00930 [Bdellovibrionales bacterium GWA2_49_15]HAZ11765.1 group 1 glycosyl transferase [Bdellovibrionales bacterium]